MGWSTRSGDAGTERGPAGVTNAGRGEVLAEGQVTLLRVPVDAFLRAVWSLIEDHGIVVQLDVPGGPLDANEWRECWRHRVMDPVSNQRVPMTGGPLLPHAPKVLSTNPDSVRRLAS